MTSAAAQNRAWCDEAIRRVQADAHRSADTHLHQLPLPASWGIDVYLKDESVHPTGSLKHRLARSLFLYALANGWLREGSTVVEATSGNSAVAEAYFARMLDLPYVAVMPRSTSPEKIARIEAYGGRCHFVDTPPNIYPEAERIAAATWIVAAAGTGGTSCTIGRYIRYRRHATRLLVVDPENSAYYPGWQAGVSDYTTGMPSRIEGIGRPRMEASFVASVIDDMLPVPDAASVAAMRHLAEVYRRRAGASTGTCLWGVWSLVAGMRERGETGSIVTLLCDPGELYTSTYYDDDWLAAKDLDPAPYRAQIDSLLDGGPFRR